MQNFASKKKKCKPTSQWEIFFITKQILVKVFTTFWLLNKIIAKKRWNLNLIFLQIMNLMSANIWLQ